MRGPKLAGFELLRGEVPSRKASLRKLAVSLFHYSGDGFQCRASASTHSSHPVRPFLKGFLFKFKRTVAR
jgi:hypothetical protein